MSIPVRQRLHFLSGDTKVSDVNLVLTVHSELLLAFFFFFALFLMKYGLDLSFCLLCNCIRF